MKDVKDFTTYLKVEKNYSNYTIKNYQLDIESFLDDCKENNIDYLKITYQEARSYVNRLYNEKHEKATSVSRKISSIRSFYRYLANNKKENYSFPCNIFNKSILKIYLEALALLIIITL